MTKLQEEMLKAAGLSTEDLKTYSDRAGQNNGTSAIHSCYDRHADR